MLGLGSNIINELIIKNHLNLGDLLNLRMSCKTLYKFTDINDKDNNEFLWKFYYLKNQMQNYKILPNSVKICPNERSCYYEWYRKIYYPCYFCNKPNDPKSTDEVFNRLFKEKDLYLKNLFIDCCEKKPGHLSYKQIYEFWKDLGSPCVHLHHYDLSTCGFNCEKKPRNYKCFFKEIAKRQKTKYKKILSLKENNIEYRENIIKNCEAEIERQKKNLEIYVLKLQSLKHTTEKNNILEDYLKTAIKSKKNN